MWKENATDYPNIYDKSIQKDMGTIIEFLEKNIDLKDKTILDIGCGNGNFSLLISNKVKSIVALDISSSMLDELNKIAKKENITNIKTINSKWEDYNIVENFDLIIGLFTPAIQNNNDFKKIMDKAKDGILYGRFYQNSIDICESIKKEYNIIDDESSFKLPFLKYKQISFPTIFSNTFFYENIFSLCKNKLEISDENLHNSLHRFKDDNDTILATTRAIKEVYFIEKEDNKENNEI